MAYLLGNICTKNYWNPTTIVEIIVGGWVVSFFQDTVYICKYDAAYCYRPSIVVCRSVCHSNDPLKTAEPIEMPFGLRTRVGTRNHMLGGVQIPIGNGKF